MSALVHDDRAFKRAIIISVSAHLALFILILISPYLPKPSRRGMVHYVNVISLSYNMLIIVVRLLLHLDEAIKELVNT